MNFYKIFTIIVLLISIGVGVGYLLAYQQKDQLSIEPGKIDMLSGDISDSPDDPVLSTDDATPSGSLISFKKLVAITPDDAYSYGAFCRVNKVPSEDKFFVTFGGSNREVQQSNQTFSPFGGAEGGNGYSYKIYDANFDYTGKTGLIHSGGGDAASVMADDYYYFLIGAPPNDWIIKKFDPSSLEIVDSVIIDMTPGSEILNDMMLAYANNNLIASGLYDATGTAGGDQTKSDPTAGMATHNRLFNTDLDFIDRFILNDVPHINGSYVVFANNAYNYITSTAFFGDLIVMRYDTNWKFIDSKTLDENAQWSQGAVFDETTNRFYVAFLDLPLTSDNKIKRGEAINVSLGIYDKSWSLIEKINVTGFEEADKKGPGRPSVVLANEKLYVSYDVSTTPELGQGENQDWQCTVSIYDL